MNNKPVAWMWSEDGCSLGVCLDQDKQIGKQEFQDYDIPLYTHPVNPKYDPETGEPLIDGYPLFSGLPHPVKELNDGGEPVKNATYWKRQYNLMATQNDNLKSGLYHANEQIKYLESHPAELTDEEINELYADYQNPDYYSREVIFDQLGFARAILRKAQEK
jgi:hypothetical protein